MVFSIITEYIFGSNTIADDKKATSNNITVQEDLDSRPNINTNYDSEKIDNTSIYNHKNNHYFTKKLMEIYEKKYNTVKLDNLKEAVPALYTAKRNLSSLKAIFFNNEKAQKLISLIENDLFLLTRAEVNNLILDKIISTQEQNNKVPEQVKYIPQREEAKQIDSKISALIQERHQELKELSDKGTSRKNFSIAKEELNKKFQKNNNINNTKNYQTPIDTEAKKNFNEKYGHTKKLLEEIFANKPDIKSIRK